MSRLRVYALLALLLLNAVVIYLLQADPRGRYHLWVFARGQGMLVLTPAGEAVLVDGGEDPVALAVALGRYMPPLRRRLSLVVLTRADEGVLAAQADLFTRYVPEDGWWPPEARALPAAAAWENAFSGQVHTLAPARTSNVGGVYISAGPGPGLLVVHLGQMRVIYAAGEHETAGLQPLGSTTLWVGPWVPLPEAVGPLPPLLYLTRPLDPTDETGAMALLRYHATRVFENQPVLHIVTDGREYTWEVLESGF